MSFKFSKSQLVDLAVANLISVFNERDATKRLEAMKAAYEPSVTLIDPNDVVVGFEAVSAFVEKLLGDSPSWEFQHTGKAWVNHDLVTMAWTFGPYGEDPAVRGNDIILVNNNGKIGKIYTMIEGQSDVSVS